MSENNVIDFPFVWHGPAELVAPSNWPVSLVRWRCEVHGVHDQVIHVTTLHGESRSYCIACVVDLLDGIGLRSLQRVGGP